MSEYSYQRRHAIHDTCYECSLHQIAVHLMIGNVAIAMQFVLINKAMTCFICNQFDLVHENQFEIVHNVNQHFNN